MPIQEIVVLYDKYGAGSDSHKNFLILKGFGLDQAKSIATDLGLDPKDLFYNDPWSSECCYIKFDDNIPQDKMVSMAGKFAEAKAITGSIGKNNTAAREYSEFAPGKRM